MNPKNDHGYDETDVSISQLEANKRREAELNAAAARIVDSAGDHFSHSLSPQYERANFSPCTNPADTAILKQAMREKGWRLNLIDNVTGENPFFVRYLQAGQQPSAVCAPTEELAVTEAAVKAVGAVTAPKPEPLPRDYSKHPKDCTCDFCCE